MKNILTLFASFLLFANAINAQDICSTDEYIKYLEELHPELKAINQSYEEQLHNALQQIDFSQVANSSGKTTDFLDTTTQYTIPIVFHILHTYGNDWISDAQVISCVSSTNEDYNGCYSDTSYVVPYYKDKVGDGRITFKLANKDPNGNCTNGIERIFTYKTISGTDAAKINQWPPDKYVNVWVAQTASKGGNAAAYAIKPPTASLVPFRDGIISANDYVGGRTIGARTHTIAHELGHIFSLDHVWGGTNNPGVACGDDGILDTPPTKGNLLVNCSDPRVLYNRPTDCWDDTTAYPWHKMYLLDTNCVENVQNFMDYSYCYRMFTKGQMRAVRGVIQNITGSSTNGQRENLTSAANLALTGTDGNPVLCDPIADFNGDTRFILKSTNTLLLRNFTYNTPLNGATYNWSTPNGSPSTSTNGTYFAPSFASTQGWQDVTLEAKVAGRTGTTTKKEYLFVQRPDQAVGVQDFEDDNRNYWWPTFNYSDNAFYWDITDVGSYGGTKCMVYRGFDKRTYPANVINTASYDQDDFFSEVFNVPNSGDAYLNFWLAGAATSSSPTSTQDDALEISFSTDGGKNWYLIPSGGTIKGSDLYPNGVSLTEYIPGGYWDYSPITVKLPNIAKTSSTLFRFRMKPGDRSNNIYVDNIEVTQYPTRINELKGDDYVFSPNPLSNSSDLVITSKNSLENTQITISDISGRVIYKTLVTDADNTEVISRKLFPTPGLYLVNLLKDGAQHTEKLSVL